MSERRQSTDATRMLDQLRDFEQRLNRLENGGAIAGRLSFGSVVTFGGETGAPAVELAVIDVGGGVIHLVFTNTVTGVSATTVL